MPLRFQPLEFDCHRRLHASLPKRRFVSYISRLVVISLIGITVPEFETAFDSDTRLSQAYRELCSVIREGKGCFNHCHFRKEASSYLTASNAPNAHRIVLLGESRCLPKFHFPYTVVRSKTSPRNQCAAQLQSLTSRQRRLIQSCRHPAAAKSSGLQRFHKTTNTPIDYLSSALFHPILTTRSASLRVEESMFAGSCRLGCVELARGGPAC